MEGRSGMAGCSWRKLSIGGVLLLLVLLAAAHLNWPQVPADYAPLPLIFRRALPGLCLVLAWFFLFDFVRDGRFAAWFQAVLGIAGPDAPAEQGSARSRWLW